jgi:hypothetical protein
MEPSQASAATATRDTPRVSVIRQGGMAADGRSAGMNDSISLIAGVNLMKK